MKEDCNQTLDKTMFELWRQDDNGNLFKVGDFANLEQAETRLKELTRNTHKQIYWIKESRV